MLYLHAHLDLTFYFKNFFASSIDCLLLTSGALNVHFSKHCDILEEN